MILNKQEEDPMIVDQILSVYDLPDNSKVKSLLDLGPGDALEFESLSTVIQLFDTFLKNLDAKSKSTLLEDLANLLCFMSKKKKGKKKSPNAEVVAWLNILGPLIIKHDKKELDMSNVELIDLETISFSISSADGAVSDILLPRFDVCYLLPNVFSMPVRLPTV
jgi:hypothetical protein